jgi:glycerol uptake facilitator protein
MFPELIAEFAGTLVLMLFGIGVVVMTTLFATGTPGEITQSGFTNIAVGWGLAVTMATWLVSRISGAHLNPAVTFAYAIYRDFPWRKVAPFMAAQTLGAFCAAALVYWNYLPAFQMFDPGLEKTAALFTTLPAFPQDPFSGLLDQTIGTALLLLIMLALAEDRSQAPTPAMGALMLGLGVVAIDLSFGGTHGYAINPARDFGPRLFSVLAGFHDNGLTEGPRIFWVPIAGPILGAIIGSAVYDYAIRRYLADD